MNLYGRPLWITLIAVSRWLTTLDVLGNWRYVVQDDIQQAGGIEARQQLFLKGDIGKELRKNYMMTARVPLHPLMALNTDYSEAQTGLMGPLSHTALSFVHGGLSPQVNYSPYPSKLNTIGERLVKTLQAQKSPPGPGFSSQDLPFLPDSLKKAETVRPRGSPVLGSM